MAVCIRDLLPPPVAAPMGTGVLMIRGISLPEIVGLLAKHKDNIVPFFEGKKVNYTELVATAPEMVADMIAIAGDCVGQEGDIKVFPLADQVSVLTAVWKLSVPDLKKLEESLAGVLATLAKGGDPRKALLSKSTLQSVSANSSDEGTDSQTSAPTP